MHINVAPPAKSKSGLSIGSLIGPLEQIFCVYSLLYATGGMDVITGSVAFVSLMRYSVLGMSILLLGFRWRATLTALRRTRLLWILIIWISLSFLWSTEPTITFDAIKGQVIPAYAFSLYFATRFNIRQQIRLVAVTLAIVALFSLYYAVAVPSIGRHVGDKFDGAWKGIYMEKNKFSAMMTLTLLAFFVLNSFNKIKLERNLARLGLAFSISMILLSTSVTGLLIFILLLILLIAFQAYRWQGRRSILIGDVIVAAVVITGSIVLQNWLPIMETLDKDPTMSGRTIIWYGTWMQIFERPWLGYGLEAVWLNGSSYASEVGRLIHRSFIPAHAHNGFLDMILDIGWIGFTFFFVGFLSTFRAAANRAYIAKAPEDYWPLAICLLMLFYNITESVLLRGSNFFWVVYMCVFISIRTWPRQTEILEASEPLSQAPNRARRLSAK